MARCRDRPQRLGWGLSGSRGIERMTDEQDVVQALEESLEALLPGCVVLDRRLDVEEGPSADLVCCDADGRLHLVVLVEGGAQETVILALDTTSFLRRHADVIARHVGGDANAELEPRLVLVAKHFSPRAAARLAPLMGEDSDALRLFELRSMQSDRGEALWFARVWPGSDEGGAQLVSFDTFVSRLGEEKQGLARAFEKDLRRVDPETRCEAKRDRVTWWLEDAELCTLRCKDGNLALEVPGHDVFALNSNADRVSALDGVMELVLEQVVEQDDEPVDHEPIVMAEPVALLTPEELEAFRDF